MLKIKRFLVLPLLCLSLLAGLNSCEEKPIDQVILPQNLTWKIDYATSPKGKVTITMKADNANYYSAIFSDLNGDNTIETPTGIASYTFGKDGNYLVTIKAHTSAADYIKATDTIRIEAVTLNDGYSTPSSYSGYKLAWADEFSGETLDLSSWGFDVGNGSGGWGNNEWQYYTSGNANCTVANGKLTITTRKESQGGYNYTSARIKTQGKREFQFGRIDIRARLPKGQGIWPALWMLGANFSTVLRFIIR